MSTKIQWTDETWNTVSGCTRVSSGCDLCYAVKMSHRLEGMGQTKYAGLTVLNIRGDRHFNGTVRTHPDTLEKPLYWRKPRMIFVNSMGDTFHDKVPFDFLDRMFAVMALCPQHTFQVLTKRPERMAEYLNDADAQHRIAKAMDAIEVQREIDALSEAWKPVNGYPGYEVSNHGRVRGPRGILSPDIGEQGHSRVTLYSDGDRDRVLVHRLVLRVWRDQAWSSDEQVRHRNGDATCNALPNLICGDQAANWGDSKRHGSHRRYSKLSPDDVAAIRERSRAGESAYSIAKDYPVSDTQIRNIQTAAQWSTDAGIAWPLPRVWLGTSCEDQATADARIPHLLRCPAAVRFLSLEPMLGPVDLSEWLFCDACRHSGPWGPGAINDPLSNAAGGRPFFECGCSEIHWVIVGGESGPVDRVRPCDLDWARSVRDQCRSAGVAFFFKQAGRRPVENGVPLRLKDSHGGDLDELPEDLRVREFPVVAP